MRWLHVIRPLIRKSGRAGGLALSRIIRACIFLRAPRHRTLRFATLFADLAGPIGRNSIRGLLDGLGASRNTAVQAQAHHIALRHHEFDRAEAIELHFAPVDDAASHLHLAIKRHLASGNDTDAVRAILDTCEPGDHKLAFALGRLGRFEELLQHTATSEDATVLAARSWAEEQLGDLEAARVNAERALLNADCGPALAAGIGLRFPELERPLFDKTLDQIEYLWQLGELDELHAVATSRRDSSHLNFGDFRVAQAHYVQRQFEAADSIASALESTHLRWDARKLRARIAFELGNDKQALALREGQEIPNETFDEVLFFSMLAAGKRQEALNSYLTQVDRRRLGYHFGQLLTTDPTSVHDESVLLLLQNGPGDAIIAATQIAEFRDRCKELAIACDERLIPLFSDAFPTCEFHAVASRPTTPVGLPQLKTPEPFASLGFKEIDVRQFDTVIASRSLLRLGAERRPVEPLFASANSSENAGSKPIGVVWRSELADPYRSIHYVRPTDLAALRHLNRRIICLQHDPTEQEIQELRQTLGDIIVPKVDLRNNFVATRQLIYGCAAVVGPGTTLTELSAACGTPTVMLHPNRFGAWRASDDAQDHWHKSMKAALAPDITRRSSSVEAASAILGRLVNRSDRSL